MTREQYFEAEHSVPFASQPERSVRQKLGSLFTRTAFIESTFPADMPVMDRDTLEKAQAFMANQTPEEWAENMKWAFGED